MNLFLPYADDIDKSVQSLDNRRLCKQILECKTMLDIANDPTHTGGYARHPIVRHYTSTKRQIKFLRYYANKCCEEYKFRFGKEHAYAKYMPKTKYFLGKPTYTPVYIEGSKPIQYWTTVHEDVSDLYKLKLLNKWFHDKYSPKWTNRDSVSFKENEFYNFEASLKIYLDIQRIQREMNEK